MGNTTRKKLDQTKQAMARLRAHRKATGECLSGCGKRARPGQLYCGDCLNDKRWDKNQRKDRRGHIGVCPRCGEQTLFLRLSRSRPLCFSTACIAEMYAYRRKKGDAMIPSQRDAVGRFLGILLGVGPETFSAIARGEISAADLVLYLHARNLGRLRRRSRRSKRRNRVNLHSTPAEDHRNFEASP